MPRLIDADELKKQAYRSGDWDKPMVVDVEAVDDAPTIDQWHYPSKGEYPTEKELVLMKIPGCYVLGWYDDGNWFLDDGKFTLLEVSRWQYIVPPREEA